VVNQLLIRTLDFSMQIFRLTAHRRCAAYRSACT
jgi:hypothetical protein